MLANSTPNQLALGTLDPKVQKPGAYLYLLLDFISNQLPAWRDDPQRPPETSEDALNGQLCEYLNSVSRHSEWDNLQFRTEVPDEKHKGRSIDISPKPTQTVWVAGRQYTRYQALLPIECKRLPTPKGSMRDMREYVLNSHKSAGGIQRFKLGFHGAAHNLAAMVGYVQEHDCEFWRKEITKWITKLAGTDPAAWETSECPIAVHHDPTRRLMRLRSNHKRATNPLELLHFWIEMK